MLRTPKPGILRQFPYLDMTERKVGIFGKLTKLDTPLKPGDRVKIYHSIVADPKTVPRRRMGDEDDED